MSVSVLSKTVVLFYPVFQLPLIKAVCLIKSTEMKTSGSTHFKIIFYFHRLSCCLFLCQIIINYLITIITLMNCFDKISNNYVKNALIIHINIKIVKEKYFLGIIPDRDSDTLINCTTHRLK